ncbi:XkdQ/YqbQ family protein [Tumebacillus lipolyticus]|uniref:YqbQ/XkdQ domain-containing protein n=1 Tax=Tumebacillus lipolyticus TaxID=1280370 RepID=A0ABW4ZXJ6_9BACL
MLEVLIDNKDGNVWDISELTQSVTWKTGRIGKASSAEISFVKGGIYENKTFKYNNGDIVRVRKDGANVFYGYIFSIDSGRDEQVKLTAYDQIRYLMSNDTYVFKAATATQVVQKIAGDFGLKLGGMADTGYKIPTLVEDNKKLLDIICKALDLTLFSTGRNYMFYDDFGKLTLRNIEEMKVDVAIGGGSLLYDYEYKRSIDNETYNRIKIVKENKETGRRDVYIAQDSANIAKWGRLQLLQKADEKQNAAQITEMLTNLLTINNRERRTIKLNAIGDLRIRAGCYVPVIIEELGLQHYFLVEECTHDLDGEDHTMTLDLRVI